MVIRNLGIKLPFPKPVAGYLAIVLASEVLEEATGNEARKGDLHSSAGILSRQTVVAVSHRLDEEEVRMRNFKGRRPTTCIAIAMILALIGAACGDDEPAPTTQAPATATAAPDTTAAATTTEAAAEAPEEQTAPEEQMTAPTELNIAMVMRGTKEEGWNATFIDSMNRLAQDQPRGLAINLTQIEEIPFADGERVIRDLAQTGDYEIIVTHSTYSDSVAAVKDDFPDIMFAYSGSGNDPLGGNGYWIDTFVHEPAYLAGIIAGSLTQTDRISAVAAFPFPNVNAPVNAFFDGARSVNPEINVDVAYIESWFDPATGQEAAAAQIAAGSDMIYAERFGPFAAAEEAGNVRAFGHFTDQLALSATVLTSAVARWDAVLLDLIDIWYANVTEGVAYDAPMERIVYLSMVDGGSSLGELSFDIPAEVVAAVEEARGAILSGNLVVPLNVESPDG